jgi:outer membrane protein TolC
MRKEMILAFATCMLASAASAQEVLTLEACRQEALQYNKEMAAAKKQTEAARLTMLSYRGNFLPDFSASGTGLYSPTSGSFGLEGGNLPVFTLDASTGQALQTAQIAYFPGINLDYRIGLVYTGGLHIDQPLYYGGKITAAYRMAQAGHRLARLNERLTSTEVIVKTDEAYALLVKAQELTEVARKYESLLEELRKNVESAYRHGLKPKNDVLKVQVKQNECELNVRRAENALRLATMNLCHLLGRPLTSTLTVDADYPEVEEVPALYSPRASYILDISKRPEVGMLDEQVTIARQQVKLDRSALLPQVGVRGAFDYLHGLEVNDRNLIDKSGVSVLLNVKVPIYHFGERSRKVQASKAKLEQTRLQQQNLTEQMQLELAQAANNLDEARLEADLAGKSLQQAEENMHVSRSQYDAGLETLSDHLEAQALWHQAYATQVNAKFQLYLSGVAYRKAAGEL